MKDFEKALRLGLGRAYLYVKENGDEGLQNVILQHCLKNSCYDAQSEPSRAPWLISVLDLCADPQYYFRKIISELAVSQDHWDVSQLYDLCLILAERDDKEAVRAIYARFDRQDFDEFWMGGYHIIELHGCKGVTHVARIIGQRLLCEEDYWDGDSYRHACELYTTERVDKHLDGLASEDPAIAAYLSEGRRSYKAEGKGNPRLSPEERREKTRQNFPLETILSLIENPTVNPSACLRFGNVATDDELKIICDLLKTEHRDEQLLYALWVFRRRELPILLDCIFDLAQSENQKLRQAAIRALMHTENPAVRDLALTFHKDGDLIKFVDSLELFVNNYQPHDHCVIEAVLIETDDIELRQTIGSVLIKIFEKHPVPELLTCMLWAYGNLPCAHCRWEVLELLVEANLLPESIAQECLLDSYEETNTLAQNFLSGVK